MAIVTGTDDPDTLAGTSNAADTIYGLGGNDTLNGQGGIDIFIGGAGADRLNGSTSLVGAYGLDTASYETALAGVFASLANSSQNTGDALGDVYFSIDNLTGSGFSDILVGNAAANIMSGGAGGDWLDGGDGQNILYGGDGDDLLGGGSDSDELQGGNGDDVIYGGAGNDVIYGDNANPMFPYPGDDSLIGGVGADHLYGGDGIDTASYETAASGVTAYLDRDFANAGDAAGDTYDGMQVVNTTYFLSFIENLTGSAFGDRLTGDYGANLLQGGGGDDTLDGGQANDTLLGGAGVDLLSGGTGADEIDGGEGDGSLYGGQDDDLYFVGNIGTFAYEAAGEGHDTVRSSVRYVLGENIEDLVLTGTSGVNGFGNALANALAGNSGNNYLDGGTGLDTLAGGAGDDAYALASTTIVNGGYTWDNVQEGEGGGNDTVYASADVGRYTYQLTPNVETLIATGTSIFRLWGNETANTLIGNDAANEMDGFGGNDTLDGNGGRDTLAGSAGNDYYELGDRNYLVGFEDYVYDTVIEADPAGGIDFVAVTPIADQGGNFYSNYTLTANVENGALLTVAAPIAFNLTGNGLDNVLTGASGVNGNAAVNGLFGLGGNDTLNGQGSLDVLVGGTGDDTYILADRSNVGQFKDFAYDTVTEDPGAGTDTVIVTPVVDPGGNFGTFYTLAANVENGAITGTLAFTLFGNGLANLLTGNGGANALSGGAGIDTLQGGGGNDTLTGGGEADTLDGGAGNDTYLNPGAASIVEAAGPAGGTDTVESAATFDLNPFANVERLFLTGTAAIDATGNTLNNQFIGNDSINTINGKDGNDTINAGGGADTVNGGGGSDRLIGGLQRDKIIPGADNARDEIVFTLIGESTGFTRDVITGLDLNAEDKIDLPGAVSGIAAARSGTLSLATFNANLTSVLNAAALPINNAVLFTPTSGDLVNPNMVYLVVDANGIAGYQANQDWVFQMENHTGGLDTTDFI